MKKADSISDEQWIFALLLIVSNRIDTLLERELKEFDLTTKQWFLAATIENLFDNPPTMKAIAREMGSSHQNIKQVALKLQEKGLLKLEKDKKDARVTRLRMTEESYVFCKKTQQKGTQFIKNMLIDIKEEDLVRARKLLEKLLLNLTEMENTTSTETD